jgi:tripartite-type tricarboxylate transporter receptor subunit TctC
LEEDAMRKAFTVVGILACALASLHVKAAYPERPIKMIVPWAAGGDTDNIFRPFGQVLQKHIGQTVVIANVGGASGTRGAKEAKDAPPDGYTLYSVHDYIHSTYYAGVADVQYSDFEPICLISSTASVLTASPKTPWKTWQELLADAKARPGQITVGATLASTSHFFPALIEKAAGIKFKYVSYEGLAPRMNAILGGRRHREAPSGAAQRADAQGAGRQRRVPPEPRHHGTERHARRRARQARRRLRGSGEGAGFRAVNESAGHGRSLHGPRRIREVAQAER